MTSLPTRRRTLARPLERSSVYINISFIDIFITALNGLDITTPGFAVPNQVTVQTATTGTRAGIWTWTGP